LQKRQLEIRLEMGISPISGRKLFSLFQASCSGGRNLQLARDAWGWNFSDVKKFEKILLLGKIEEKWGKRTRIAIKQKFARGFLGKFSETGNRIPKLQPCQKQRNVL